MVSAIVPVMVPGAAAGTAAWAGAAVVATGPGLQAAMLVTASKTIKLRFMDDSCSYLDGISTHRTAPRAQGSGPDNSDNSLNTDN